MSERDPRLTLGCWVKSARFGLSVLVGIADNHYLIRYEALHMNTRTPIWVLNGTSDVRWLLEADEQSERVLGLEGPYGLGPCCSDPRFRNDLGSESDPRP